MNYLFTFVTTLAVIFQGCSSLHSSSFYRLESTLKKSHLALDSTGRIRNTTIYVVKAMNTTLVVDMDKNIIKETCMKNKHLFNYSREEEKRIYPCQPPRALKEMSSLDIQRSNLFTSTTCLLFIFKVTPFDFCSLRNKSYGSSTCMDMVSLLSLVTSFSSPNPSFPE